ncbi:Glycerol-3-phosphate dehydrogenase, partial [Caligus rogercresseyi]
MVNKVCMIGSGNFASAIAINVGKNVEANPELFDPVVNMWVFEEEIDGRKLTDIITRITSTLNTCRIPLPHN